MRHELTSAIVNYVNAAIEAATARPGSFERDNARREERERLETLDAIIDKAFSERDSGT